MTELAGILTKMCAWSVHFDRKVATDINFCGEVFSSHEYLNLKKIGP